MSPEQWDQVRELFHQALDVPHNKRSEFLKASGTDTEIVSEVEAPS